MRKSFCFLFKVTSSSSNQALFVKSGKPYYFTRMEILIAGSFEEAKTIAESDPFIAEGYKTFELRTLEVANSDNNYLL